MSRTFKLGSFIRILMNEFPPQHLKIIRMLRREKSNIKQ